jgi:hypothetical protein
MTTDTFFYTSRSVQQKLADTYYALERYDEALDAYNAYLTITGDNAEAEVVERVQELEARLGED